MENIEEFVLSLLADFGVHAVPSEVGNILVRQQLILGNKNDESMRSFQFQARAAANGLLIFQKV